MKEEDSRQRGLQCKGPEAELSSVYWENGKKVVTAGVEHVRGRGDEVKEAFRGASGPR